MTTYRTPTDCCPPITPGIGGKRPITCEHGERYLSEAQLHKVSVGVGAERLERPSREARGVRDNPDLGADSSTLITTSELGPMSSPRRRKRREHRELKRDWTDARTKVEFEGACRYCRVEYAHLEAAHIIGRKHDGPHPDGTKRLWVDPDRIVPLCPEHHHAYDAHQLDPLGYLSVEEQIRAVADCGSLEIARRRIAPGAYLEFAA